MSTTDTTTQVPWWTLPEFQGELELPGQSRLSSKSKLLLETLSKSVEAGTVEIPPLPKAAMEASKLLRDIDPDMNAVTHCIGTDASLAAQVLRFANSPMGGARVTINTLPQAVNHIGQRRMKTLILQIAMSRMVGDVGAQSWATLEWTYSMHAAVIARVIAPLVKSDPEVCYLAGLLHDIGRLPLLRVVNAKGALPQKPETDNEIDIILECLHRAVGRDVAKAWDMPPAIADAIGSHLNGRRQDEASMGQFGSTLAAEAASDLCIAMGVGRQRRPFDVANCR